MTIEELERLLLAHGADPAHWPADRRAAAEALLARDEAARALLAEAERFDATLAAAVETPAAGGALANRILAALDGDAKGERELGLGRLLAWAGSAAAAALVAGFVLGQSLTAPDPARGMLALVGGDLTEIEALP
jgi:anti-sigma factor RsiW